MQPVVLMVIFVLLEVMITVKVVLKFASVIHGEQCVMISGMKLMEWWLVNN